MPAGLQFVVKDSDETYRRAIAAAPIVYYSPQDMDYDIGRRNADPSGKSLVQSWGRIKRSTILFRMGYTA